MIGILPAESGNINLLGERVVNHEIPSVSNRIGYLPQETSLIAELSVKETLYFFANIYQYDKDKIDERYQMLHNLLELPPDDRRVENCSGGQQRRVSFASALMHEPNLLILDEPTVGLDPVLRDKTWQFLVEITKNLHTTVIITTHYIEEARLSNRCGLMRNGVLLEEGPPEHLIAKHGCASLEETFLKLCLRQGSDELTEKLETVKSFVDNQPINEVANELTQRQTNNFKKREFFTMQTFKALVMRNFFMNIRQPL